jgi:hypothetical protein
MTEFDKIVERMAAHAAEKLDVPVGKIRHRRINLFFDGEYGGYFYEDGNDDHGLQVYYEEDGEPQITGEYTG